MRGDEVLQGRLNSTSTFWVAILMHWNSVRDVSFPSKLMLFDVVNFKVLPTNRLATYRALLSLTVID